MSTGEQRQNSASATEEEVGNHQERNDIDKLKEKIESTYCYVTQIETVKDQACRNPEYV
jgi:hypothetical protein